MTQSFAAAAVIAALSWADGDGLPSIALDGHTLRVEHVSASRAWDRGDGRLVRNVAIAFAVDSKNASKSYAFEIGSRIVARDAAGQEIPLGRSFAGGREPALRLAGYSKVARPGQPGSMPDSLTATIPLFKTDAAEIATLEGDLFVSDVEVAEFTFPKSEWTPNVVKKVGSAAAKLYMFDERERGVDIGFKLDLPVRGRAESLIGNSAPRERPLLFADSGGRKSLLFAPGSGGHGGGEELGESGRVRVVRQFLGVVLPANPDSLHLVVPVIEYPRRFPFRLGPLTIPAAPPARGVRAGGAKGTR